MHDNFKISLHFPVCALPDGGLGGKRNGVSKKPTCMYKNPRAASKTLSLTTNASLAFSEKSWKTKPTRSAD